MNDKKCSRCDGDGEVLDPANPTHFPMLCPRCGGTGRPSSTKTFRDGIGQGVHASTPNGEAGKT